MPETPKPEAPVTPLENPSAPVIHEASRTVPLTKEAQEQRKNECIALAEKLEARKEAIPFPGVDEKRFAALLADLTPEDAEFTGIDEAFMHELVKRFAQQGCRVLLTAHRKSGNILVVPKDSTDIDKDSLRPKHFSAEGAPDLEFQLLIRMQQEMYPLGS